MALTKTPIELSSTPGIVDNSNAAAITIDASENVGIGVSNPSDYYANNLVVGAGSEGGITIASSATTYNNYLAFADGSSSVARYAGLISYDHNINDMHFRTSSLERMRIDSAGNVGIGTNSPVTFGAGTAGLTVNGVSGSQISWQNNGTNVGFVYNVGNNFYIGSEQVGSSTVFISAGTERLRIDSAGNVGIGTSSPTQELEIKAASIPTLKLNQAGTYGAEIALRGNDLDIAGSANAIVFYTGGNNDVSTTERMRILPTGGITFNGDTAQANALDDYEEGTWTPTITGDSGSTSGQSYGTVTAHYVKIGQLVYLGFDVTLTAAGSLGGSYGVVSNLPFPTLNSNLGGGSLGYYINISNATGPITFYVAASQAYLMKGGSTYVANSDITNNTRLLGFLSYRTSA